MSKRFFAMSLALTLCLFGATYAQLSNPVQVIDPFGGQVVLTPGFNFSTISPTVGGRALNVTSLTLTNPGTNVLVPSNFQLFDTSGIFSSIIPFNNGGANWTNNGAAANLSIGNVAWPQVSPAAAPNIIPGSLSGLAAGDPQYQLQAAQPNGPGLAAARPDFNYVSRKLEFEKLTDSRTGQKDLDLAPAGTRRFIPVGEF